LYDDILSGMQEDRNMCGIIGYVGRQEALPIIVEGLKKLEYRGYDSAGIAIAGVSGIDVVKQKGRIAVLENALKNSPMTGTSGIGHTRWATHGEPSDTNSHPHIGEKRNIAVVHNGIIENYGQIKEMLIAKGVTFTSQTDSEVVPQLAEHYYKDDLVSCVAKVLSVLEGSYALGFVCVNEPGTIVAAKKDNPLIVGVGNDGHFIASDVPAVLKHTDKVYYLNDKEIAVLKEGKVTFYNQNLEILEKTLETITWSIDSAEKGGYPHFMLKEIMEQPRVAAETIRSAVQGKNASSLSGLDVSKFNKIVITGCGSAYNAGVVAKYVFERLTRVSVEVELASEFRYKDPIIDENTLVVLISQSGETADTIAAMRCAAEKGAATLSIVNVVGSTIHKEADIALLTMAGPEIAVATTKAFSTQLVMLYMLSIEYAHKLGKIDNTQRIQFIAEIEKLPEKIEEVLTKVDDIQKFGANSVNHKSIFFIGRNIDYAIALEGSLKLKEISYIHSEAYAGGELKHGTISLVTEDTLVVAIANCPALLGKIMNNVEQVISRKAQVLLIGAQDGALKIENEKMSYISLPVCNELFSPSLSVIVLQLFSYYVAANKGLDIDKPRNLAKSVTVE